MILFYFQREAQEREEAEQVRQERIRKEQEEEREVRFAWNLTGLVTVSITRFICQAQGMVKQRKSETLNNSPFQSCLIQAM